MYRCLFYSRQGPYLSWGPKWHIRSLTSGLPQPLCYIYVVTEQSKNFTSHCSLSLSLLLPFERPSRKPYRYHIQSHGGHPTQSRLSERARKSSRYASTPQHQLRKCYARSRGCYRQSSSSKHFGCVCASSEVSPVRQLSLFELLQERYKLANCDRYVVVGAFCFAPI